ncbi:YopT-type cysteine protease domain-containing protein [Corallococcus aberystwythensis]|uniref:Peptidase C58 YopT-type domain-containing protein n=1 Tax=Corallococcus aberystwythensis TaxID=2316722 RepID=A0A3A8QP48_9BACT|nr:YopT-type cysteine protease domain-containing protein [Corallococcus aberystwythensis]RKH68125.1 hypothetical protein D7W81_12975 [Corallococcus aberystwythensis]
MNLFASAQAHDGTQTQTYSQSEYMSAFQQAHEGVRRGVCLGFSMVWLGALINKKDTFWDWCKTQEGIEHIAMTQAEAHGRGKTGFGESEDRQEYIASYLDAVSLRESKSFKIASDDAIVETFLSHVAGGRICLMSLKRKKEDVSGSNHAVASYMDGKNLIFMDPNFGEVVFPLQTLPLSASSEKSNVNLTSLGIETGPRFPGDGLHEVAMLQLSKKSSSLQGWSTAPTPALPRSRLVDDFAVSPSDPRLTKFSKWFDFYLRRSGYLSKYVECRVSFFS